eukprot:gene38499-47544_t
MQALTEQPYSEAIVARQILAPSLLRELLHYDAASGALTWKVAISSRVKSGDTAYSEPNRGYFYVRIFTAKYPAHRIAWAIAMGEYPVGEIDHINGHRSDNRLSNLRDVSHQTNNENRRLPNPGKISCKLLGATYDEAADSWKAQISKGGKNIHIGRYSSAEEAHAAYLDAKRRLHVGCTL